MVLFEVFFGIPSDVQSIPLGLSFGLSSRFSSRLPSEVPSELPLGLPSGFPLEFPSRVRSKISGLPLWFPCLPFYHAFGITSEVPSGLPSERDWSHSSSSSFICMLFFGLYSASSSFWLAKGVRGFLVFQFLFDFVFVLTCGWIRDFLYFGSYSTSSWFWLPNGTRSAIFSLGRGWIGTTDANTASCSFRIASSDERILRCSSLDHFRFTVLVSTIFEGLSANIVVVSFSVIRICLDGWSVCGYSESCSLVSP